MARNLVRGAWYGGLLAAVLVAFDGEPVGAQQQANGTIRGQVTDAVTMRPLSGAQVSVPGTGRGALANASGQFLILSVPPGQQTVRVELIGYAQAEQQVAILAGQAPRRTSA
jgi:hypothetical protein